MRVTGWSSTLAVLALGTCVAASAQTIEISSASIGTVRVAPGAIAPRATTARQPAMRAPRNAPNATSAGVGPRNGIDLGIRRKPDGTLYDPLDPNQNPAAAHSGTVVPPTSARAAYPSAGRMGASAPAQR